MTLWNARINTIHTPGVPTPSGDAGAYTDTAVNGVECLADEVRTNQRLVLGAKIADATTALYVRHQKMDVLQLMIGRDVTITLNGSTPKRYRILHRDERVMPHDQTLSHVVCFLQPVAEG